MLAHCWHRRAAGGSFRVAFLSPVGSRVQIMTGARRRPSLRHCSTRAAVHTSASAFDTTTHPRWALHSAYRGMGCLFPKLYHSEHE